MFNKKNCNSVPVFEVLSEKCGDNTYESMTARQVAVESDYNFLS
jgi:hypothetical protein